MRHAEAPMKHLSAALWATAVAACRFAQADPQEPVITEHRIVLAGKSVTYSTEVGRVTIRDVETGEPHGYMFYTAYRVLPIHGDQRPITFIWNGGPGADSALLHFFVAGPKRASGGELTDNADSWLAASDLVMVDPIGTGFSRPVSTRYDAEFYSTKGDVASITEFVRSWRLIHGAEETPIFLVGESWGAGRAASVAYALESRGITVNGMVLISGGWGLTHEYAPESLLTALQVVDMATTALYYGKTAPDLGKDVNAVRGAAESWARDTYAPTLARVGTLSQAERTALLAQLSRFTGLAPAQIDQQKLVISPRQFRRQLLQGEGKEPYLLDMRRTTAPETTAVKAILRYFRHDLGYQTDSPYLGLENVTQGFAPSGTYPQSVNERWNYATAELSAEELKAAIERAQAEGRGPPRLGPPLPATQEALALNPRMRVLVAAGMYDSYLPCAMGAETHEHLPEKLRAAMSFKCYSGGHAMYLDDAVRVELSRDVKAVIANHRPCAPCGQAATSGAQSSE